MPEPDSLVVLAVMPGITPDAGAERSFVDVVSGLTDAGIVLHLALLTDRHALVPEVVAGGGIVHDLSSQRSLPGRVRAIRRLIREVKPAVVHSTLHEATLPAQIATIGTGATPLVTWANTSYTPEHFAGLEVPRYKLRFVQASEIVLAKVCRSRFHAVTSGVGRVNREKLFVPPDRVFVGERGRDAARFDVETDAVEKARSGLGAPDGTRFVLAAGRQDVQKGYGSLLEQFERLADRHDDVWLLIAGREGSSTATLLAQRTKMTHGDRVQFLGQRPDAAELMTMADIVVCASLREGAAGALIEAMGCGTPIVSVPIDGLEDVLTNGDNAIVTPREELADGLERVLTDPELAGRIGAGGRSTFERRFTIERSAARLAEIYREVA